MISGFPIKDVTIRQVSVTDKVLIPSFGDDCYSLNQNEFFINVPGVGSYYASGGMTVDFSVEEGADPDWVKLYLNSQVLVALLHQRRIINFHAGSFIYGGRGIMILGETGAGKSSLTVSFALNGAGFLSDDLTPVIFKSSKPYVWPLYRDIKLREDTVSQLGISREQVKEAENGTGKLYLDVSRADVSDYPLQTVLKIETGDSLKVEFHEPAPAEKFSLLRSEICSWEMLAGMPETETEYLHQLLAIVEQVHIVRVVRPVYIKVAELHEAVKQYLDQLTD